MKARMITGLALAAILVSGMALAQADSPTAEQWWAHVSFLASDQLAGRMTGTADYTKAEEYVQTQFKEAGLAPAGTQGFLQEVGFKSVEVNPAASNFEVEHAGAKTSLAVGTEVVLSPRIDADSTVNAPAVFAGYGFAAPSQHFDDVAGLDLKGKVAVVLAGNPPSVHGPLRAYYIAPPPNVGEHFRQPVQLA